MAQKDSTKLYKYMNVKNIGSLGSVIDKIIPAKEFMDDLTIFKKQTKNTGVIDKVKYNH